MARCPNLNLLATAVRDIPKDCLAQRSDALGAAIRMGRWAMNQYRAVSPETKRMIADVASDTALRMAVGPFGMIALDYLKK